MTAARTHRLVVCGLVVASYALWRWLHRYWVMVGDDYLFLDGPRGRFSVRFWVNALIHDWLHRNGRMADAVLRLVLRPGPWFYPWLAPALLTGLGVAFVLALKKERDDGSVSLWVWASALLAPPTVLGMCPTMTGDIALWAAATINYVLPTCLVLLALRLHLLLSRGHDLGWVEGALWGILMLLADVLHESSSMAMFLVAILTVVLGRSGLRAVSYTHLTLPTTPYV